MDDNLKKFWMANWEAWKNGLSSDDTGRYVEEAGGEFEDFLKKPLASILINEHFFEKNPPKPDEYIIRFYTGQGMMLGKVVMVLTNQRLWLYNSATKQFDVVNVADISELNTTQDFWGSNATILFKNGTTQEFKKVDGCPDYNDIQTAINECQNPFKVRTENNSPGENNQNIPAALVASTCAICSKADLGKAPNSVEWAVVKKTGQIKKKHWIFAGHPMGGRTDVTAFQVDLISKITTSICESCAGSLENKAEMEGNKALEKTRQGIARSRLNAKKAAKITAIIVGVTALYLQFVVHWPKSHFAYLIFIFSTMGLIASIYGIYAPDSQLEAPTFGSSANEIKDKAINSAHFRQVNALVGQTPAFNGAKVLLGDTNYLASDSNKQIFVMPLRRFEMDQFDGYALFLIYKIMFEPGGKRKVDMTLDELRAVARRSGTKSAPFRNVGECMVKYQD